MAKLDVTGNNLELESHINDMRDRNIVKVPESVFKHKLLPLAVARYSNIDTELPLTHWQAVTGESPTNGVAVTRNGVVLFETPPLILTPTISFDTDSILTRVKEAERNTANGVPNDDIIDESMGANIRVNKIGAALTTWIHIFRLYGIKLDIIEDADDTSAESDSTPVEDVEVKHDDRWDDEDGEYL